MLGNCMMNGFGCSFCRYMMDSKMVVISTTNKMFNTSLYDSLSPESLVRCFIQSLFHTVSALICGCGSST